VQALAQKAEKKWPARHTPPLREAGGPQALGLQVGLAWTDVMCAHHESVHWKAALIVLYGVVVDALKIRRGNGFQKIRLHPSLHRTTSRKQKARRTGLSA
jgi:hypothetical protein